ncbi:MAG: heliorhodopsin HeR [Candidatus Berkelbacteria bacterium]|nr:heliorhodopsin HeR [Candidatus Berkelbacteria bacterium]
MEEKLRKLRRFNLIMAGLHFVQGIAMLLLSNNFSLPVNASFLRFNVQTMSLVPNPETLFSLKIGPLVASFLFLSALAHLLVSTMLNKWYNNNLAKGINYARWIEYFFSSSIMIVIIAMLVGIYDIGSLLLLFFLNGMMILFGWMMELHNQSTPKTDWTSFYFGCLAGIVTWVVIALYLFGAGGGDNRAPSFVYWIYFSIFLFFNCFAINQTLQYEKVGKWSDYLYGERAYIILSLIAKSLLAWQVFAGTLRPV